MTDSLQTAIEALYAAFARYPLRAHIDGCPHCDLEDAERGLHAKPLRELTADDLGDYAWKAMTTFGNVDDFRHFFPRIAEIITYEGLAGACDVAILARKLTRGDWRRWPEPERVAIFDWLGALEKTYAHGAALVCGDAFDLLDVSTELCGTVEPFLEIWFDASSEQAVGDLAYFVTTLPPAADDRRDWAHAVYARIRADRARIERTLTAGRVGADDRWLVSHALEALALPPFA